MRRRFDLERYADALLLALYNRVVSGKDDNFTVPNIKDFLPSRSDNLARLCVDCLRSRGDVYIESRKEKRWADDGVFEGITVDVDHIFLSEHGFDRVSNWTDDEYVSVERLAARSEVPLGGSTVILPLYGSVGGSEVPASDRTVTLNHNQPDYQETVVALDKVIEEFRNDHRLDNELGHEKGAF